MICEKAQMEFLNPTSERIENAMKSRRCGKALRIGTGRGKPSFSALTLARMEMYELQLKTVEVHFNLHLGRLILLHGTS